MPLPSAVLTNLPVAASLQGAFFKEQDLPSYLSVKVSIWAILNGSWSVMNRWPWWPVRPVSFLADVVMVSSPFVYINKPFLCNVLWRTSGKKKGRMEDLQKGTKQCGTDWWFIFLFRLLEGKQQAACRRDSSPEKWEFCVVSNSLGMFHHRNVLCSKDSNSMISPTSWYKVKAGNQNGKTRSIASDTLSALDASDTIAEYCLLIGIKSWLLLDLPV